MQRAIEFFDDLHRVNKNHSSTFHVRCFYSHIETEICTLKWKANDCETITFVQSETRTIVLYTVNLRIYEIKSFHFIQLHSRYFNNLYIKFSKFFVC